MSILGPATTPGVQFLAEVALGNLNAPGESLYDTALYDTAVYSSNDISWTDISSRLEGFSVRMGREKWGQQFRGGTGSLMLSNQDGIFNPDAGLVDLGNLVLRPGRFVRISGRVKGDQLWVPLFTGRVEALADVYSDGAHRIQSRWQLTDLAAYLSLIKPPALTVPIAAGQLTSDRIIDVLTRADFQNFGGIEVGANTMLSSTLSSSYWQECQTAASAEGGAFYMAKDGSASFLNQANFRPPLGTPAVPKFAVGSLASEVEVIEADTSYGMGNVRNQVSMARIGGVAQTINNTQSQALYQTRTHQQFDLEAETDGMVFDLAQSYLDYWAYDQLSITRMGMVALSELGARQLLNLELLDVLRATIETAEGWGYTSDVSVQGLSYSADASDWSVSVSVENTDRSSPLEGGPFSTAYDDAYDPVQP